MTIMGACVSWILAFVTLLIYLNLPAFLFGDAIFNNLFLTFPILFFAVGIGLAVKD